MHDRGRLTQVRDRLARWRAEHGGRGIRLPESMWAEVVEVARGWRASGYGALRLEHARVAARMTAARMTAARMTASEIPAELRGGCVEFDAGRLGLLARTVIRFQGRDGERLDLTALAEAFWHRGR